VCALTQTLNLCFSLSGNIGAMGTPKVSCCCFLVPIVVLSLSHLSILCRFTICCCCCCFTPCCDGHCCCQQEEHCGEPPSSGANVDPRGVPLGVAEQGMLGCFLLLLLLVLLLLFVFVFDTFAVLILLLFLAVDIVALSLLFFFFFLFFCSCCCCLLLGYLLLFFFFFFLLSPSPRPRRSPSLSTCLARSRRRTRTPVTFLFLLFFFFLKFSLSTSLFLSLSLAAVVIRNFVEAVHEELELMGMQREACSLYLSLPLSLSHSPLLGEECKGRSGADREDRLEEQEDKQAAAELAEVWRERERERERESPQISVATLLPPVTKRCLNSLSLLPPRHPAQAAQAEEELQS